MTTRRYALPAMRFDIHQPRDHYGRWTDSGLQDLANAFRDGFGIDVNEHYEQHEFASGGFVEWSYDEDNQRYGLSFVDGADGSVDLDLSNSEMVELTNALGLTSLNDYNPKLDANDTESMTVFALSRNAPHSYYTNDDDLGYRYFDWTSRDGDNRRIEVANAEGDSAVFDMTESEIEEWHARLMTSILEHEHGIKPSEPEAEENAGVPAVNTRTSVRTRPRQARSVEAEAAPTDLTIVRTTLLPCGVRAEGAESERAGLGLMDVRFSPFDTWYRVASWWEGDFMERTVRGAFKRTFSAHRAATNVDSHSIKTMFNHGMDMYIDNKLLGDIDDIAEDKDSARSTVWLWDTSYNRDLLPGLRSGAYGSSFMFRIIKEDWDEEPGKSSHNPDGIPERTIREARVFEAGPVTWPASPTASAGMRCLSATDQYYEHLARRDPKAVDGMRAQRIALRNAGRIPGLAPEQPDDSRRAHSTGISARERRERLYPYLKGVQ